MKRRMLWGNTSPCWRWWGSSTGFSFDLLQGTEQWWTSPTQPNDFSPDVTDSAPSASAVHVLRAPATISSECGGSFAPRQLVMVGVARFDLRGHDWVVFVDPRFLTSLVRNLSTWCIDDDFTHRILKVIHEGERSTSSWWESVFQEQEVRLCWSSGWTCVKLVLMVLFGSSWSPHNLVLQVCWHHRQMTGGCLFLWNMLWYLGLTRVHAVTWPCSSWCVRPVSWLWLTKCPVCSWVDLLMS